MEHRASISERRAAAAAPQVQRALDSLQKLDFLEGCSQQFLRNLAVGTESKIVGPGELIFKSGAEAVEIILLRRGLAEALARSAEPSSPTSASSATSETSNLSEDEVCGRFNDGATIGHPLVLCGQQPAIWAVSLKARECCEYCVLSRKTFKAASTLYPSDGTKANSAVEAGAIGDASPRSKRMNKVMTRKMSVMNDVPLSSSPASTSHRASLRRNLAGFQLVEFNTQSIEDPSPSGAMGRRMTLTSRRMSTAVGMQDSAAIFSAIGAHMAPPLAPPSPQNDRRRSIANIRRGSMAVHASPDQLAWMQARALQAEVAAQAADDVMGRSASLPGPGQASPSPRKSVRKTQSTGASPLKRSISFAAIIEEEDGKDKDREDSSTGSESTSSCGSSDGEQASKASTPKKQGSVTGADEGRGAENEEDEEEEDSFAVQEWSADGDSDGNGDGNGSAESGEDEEDDDFVAELPPMSGRPNARSVGFLQEVQEDHAEEPDDSDGQPNTWQKAQEVRNSMTKLRGSANSTSGEHFQRIRSTIFGKMDTMKQMRMSRGSVATRGSLMSQRLSRGSTLRRVSALPGRKMTLQATERGSTSGRASVLGHNRASFVAVIQSAVKDQQDYSEKLAQKIQEGNQGNQDSLKTWAFAQQAQSEGTDRDLAAWLDQIPFFSTMAAFVFERLLPLFEKRTFKARQHILTQGQITDAMHVVYAGQVAVMLDDDEVACLGPQAVVGERVCFLEDEAPKSAASIVAQTSVVLTISMQREILVGLMARDAWMKAKIDEQFESLKENRGECSVHNMILFKDADPSFAKMLEVSMTNRTYKPGSIIASEGDTSTEAFVVSGGTFQVSVGGETLATHTVLDSLNSIIFGEMNCMGLVSKRDATVIAITTCRVQILFQDAVKKVFDEFPRDSFIFRRLVENMARANSHMTNFNPTFNQSRGTRGKSIGKVIDCDEFLSFNTDDVDDDDDDDGTSSHTTNTVEGELPSLPPSQPESRRGSRRNSALSRNSLLEAISRPGSRPESSRGPRSRPGSSRPASRPGTRPGSRRGSGGGPTVGSAELDSNVSQHQRLSVLDLVGRKANGRFTQPAKLHPRLVLDNDLTLVPDFKGCSQKCIASIGLQLQPRLYMQQQALLREGEQLMEVLILQKGTCSMTLYSDEMPTLKAPCMVAGLMTLQTAKSFATVVALEPCFVAAIPKHCFASVLDAFPTDRRRLFAKTHKSFTEYADTFQEMVASDGLARCLSSLPLFRNASPMFLAELAKFVEPRLLLPGQAVEQHQESEEPSLYILFEGYCHLLVEDTVVGTISNRMVFGEMDVFEIPDKLGHRNPIVKTVDLCKVGTIRQYSLFEVLQKHPEERHRFERLVHNRLEASVYSQISSQPCFLALAGPMLTKVCHIIERQLYLPKQDVIREGKPGDSMHIVNRGKVEVVYNGIIVGLLGPSKIFGAPQLLGVAREYHATLVTRATSHVLKLTRKNLQIIVMQGQEKKWMRSWQAQAKVEYASDMQIFRRKFREQKQLARLGMAVKAGDRFNTMEEDHLDHDSVAKELLRAGFASWREFVSAEQRRQAMQVHAQLEAFGMGLRSKKFWDANAKQGRAQRASSILLDDESPGNIVVTSAPIQYSRGLRRVELDEQADRGAMSTESWHHYAQSRRLDLWRGSPAPSWLVAVRSEIPRQLQALKAAERGEDTQLGGLIASVGYMLGS